MMVILVFFQSMTGWAQERLFIWSEGKMPNSKGMRLQDSIARERIFRVAKPEVYAFFPSKEENRHTAVLICPGGGYERLAYVVSGIQLARWLNTLGISAFVLNYRLPVSPDLKDPKLGPLMDAQRALKLIRARAKTWDIDTSRVGIMGCSAGGHLAAHASCMQQDYSRIGDSLDTQNARPDFTILVSPVIDMSSSIAHKGSVANLLGADTTKEIKEKFSMQIQVTSRHPPCFITGAANDPVVNPLNSLLYYQSLLEHDVPVSFHVFPEGGHSIALRGNPGSTNLWTTLCEAWLRDIKILESR